MRPTTLPGARPPRRTRRSLPPRLRRECRPAVLPARPRDRGDLRGGHPCRPRRQPHCRARPRSSRSSGRTAPARQRRSRRSRTSSPASAVGCGAAPSRGSAGTPAGSIPPPSRGGASCRCSRGGIAFRSSPSKRICSPAATCAGPADASFASSSTDLRVVPRGLRSAENPGPDSLRRRAADGRHRPRADDAAHARAA